jgi:hypothetical protein
LERTSTRETIVTTYIYGPLYYREDRAFQACSSDHSWTINSNASFFHARMLAAASRKAFGIAPFSDLAFDNPKHRPAPSIVDVEYKSIIAIIRR